MKVIIDEAMVCGDAAQRLFPKHPSSTLHVRPKSLDLLLEIETCLLFSDAWFREAPISHVFVQKNYCCCRGYTLCEFLLPGLLSLFLPSHLFEYDLQSDHGDGETGN